MSWSGPLDSIVSTLEGRPSLGLVVFVSLTLLWLVAALALYILLFRIYESLRNSWRARRRLVFEPGVEKVLLEEPLDAIVAAFRPKLPGDADIAQQVLVDAMRHLLGPPFETLREAARRLGFVDRSLALLRSSGPHARGRAIEALGVMRVAESRPLLLEAAAAGRLDLRLAALRSLALINDPRDLASFVAISDSLPPAMLVRLASLMMEYGPPARPRLVELMSRHPQAFPPRVMRLVLAEAAAEDERLS